MINVQVHNQSTCLSDAALAVMLVAIEDQVNQDVVPIWENQPIALGLVPKGVAMDPKLWQFIITDTSDVAGAAGYHEMTSGGKPIGFAFAKTTIDAGMNPSVTISHEILEMLGDAFIDQSNQWSDNPNAVFLAQELCDPVEDDSFAYSKAGLLVSDFVTPDYFIAGSQGPWDFRGVLKGPNTLAVGGYQLQWTPADGWQQQFAQGEAKGRAALVTPFSRRSRRVKPRHFWKRSAT